MYMFIVSDQGSNLSKINDGSFCLKSVPSLNVFYENIAYWIVSKVETLNCDQV